MGLINPQLLLNYDLKSSFNFIIQDNTGKTKISILSKTSCESCTKENESCRRCNICLHSATCSCADYQIFGNICSHLHFLFIEFNKKCEKAIELINSLYQSSESIEPNVHESLHVAEPDAPEPLLVAEPDAPESLSVAEPDAPESLPVAEPDAPEPLLIVEPDAPESLPVAEPDAPELLYAAEPNVLGSF